MRLPLALISLFQLAASPASAWPDVPTRELADAFYEKHRGPAPDGYEVVYNNCAALGCSQDRAMIAEALQLAYQKDYPSQRNLAYCLFDGCSGTIAADPVQSCAWRYVIMASDHPDLVSSDAGNLDICLSKLTWRDAELAKSRAAKLVALIYGSAFLSKLK